MLKPLRLSQYYGKNYDEFIILKKKYSIMKTGKSAKKSSTIARKIVLRAIMDQRFCAVITRKVMLDHEKSTFPAIIKAFNKLQKLTGYEWTKFWSVNKGAKNPNITNNLTGQIFRFVSFDRPESMAGLELESLELFYMFLWFEEPMQVSDKRDNHKDNAARQKDEERDFDIIVSSAFRGVLPDGGHREIVFSFNDWSDGDYWIIVKFVKPFINENYMILDKFGKQVHYDPTYENNSGIYVAVGSGGLNEFNDQDYINFITRIKKDDYEFYKAIWLGTAAQFIGNAYAEANIKKIVFQKQPEKIQEWLIGVDYSSSKDFAAMYLCGTNDDQELHIIDCFRYHRGKAKNPLPEPILIKSMWKIIQEWHSEYNFSSSDLKAEIRVDSRDATFRSYLQKHWEESKLIYQFDIQEPKPASKFGSAGMFVRLLAVRYIMGAGKMFINPDLVALVNNIKNRTIYKDGTIKDGGDDDIQAVEYSFSHKIEDMMPPLVYQNILESYAGLIQERLENAR